MLIEIIYAVMNQYKFIA